MTDEENDFDDSGEELELEPVDPEILEYQKKQVQRKTRELEDRVDVEDLFEGHVEEDPFSTEDLKKFKFSIRHLLILTALVAVVLTIAEYSDGCTATFISIVAAVSAGWWLVSKKEKQQEIARQNRKEQLKARIAAERASQDGKPIPEVLSSDGEKPTINQSHKSAFKLNFSMKQLLAVITVAALALGGIRILGGTEYAAMVLGLVALGGLVVHALGFDPPPIIVLGWWILLILYIVIGLASTVTAKTVLQPNNPTPVYSSADCLSIQSITLASSTSRGTDPPLKTVS